jgi:uracil-DNA glycosylase family 4
LEPGNRARVEAWLRYGNDLGLAPYYRERAAPVPAVPANEAVRAEWVAQTLHGMTAAAGPGEVHADLLLKTPISAAASVPARSSAVISAASGPSLFEASDRIEGDNFHHIRETIGECTRCKLHKGRTNIVFGVGSAKAQLVFVGEGPGRDEDIRGEPFVGRAGKLLTQMIEAMGLRREDVYICNVVKCRPPENRLPEKDEITTCSPFLFRQIDVIRPKVICCLGSCASQTLLQTTQGISRFRGEWFDFRGSKLIATYHPAYLLRNPNAKGEVWKDLQKVMAVLGLQPKRK